MTERGSPDKGIPLPRDFRVMAGTDSGWRTPVADALRYRIRVLDGEREVRTFEVNGALAHYGIAELETDFPGGRGTLRFAVSEWGDGWGWGVEAEAAPD